ncbi:unnamed protein product, partial [Mesorhabditis spiculigera]
MSPSSAGSLRAEESASPSANSNAPHRSTRGASKQRRDQINVEIGRMRDLLPLSESIKDRLFQLQVMSLACIFIRKHRYRPNVMPSISINPSDPSTSGCNVPPRSLDAGKALRGFLFMTTKSAKILYISENASDYLGHSVEEIMCQGDSLYDMVDCRDHIALQNLLGEGPPAEEDFPKDRVFLCRINLSRTAKRQLQFHKFVLFHGRYVHPSEYYSANQERSTNIQPIFAAFCQPLLNPENAELLSTGNTDAFSSQHFLDMRFRDMDNMFIERSGYSRSELLDMSWYALLHPENLADLAYKHRLLADEKEGSVLALMRMQTKAGQWLWLHCVMSVRSLNVNDGDNRRQRHVIHMAYQIVGENEARALQANGWIYSMRHNYPTSFTAQDSPDSLPNETPLSPASPFVLDLHNNIQPGIPLCGAQLGGPFQFGLHINRTMPMFCPQQIKVEVGLKGMHPPLCLITPEHSSPESSAPSFPSHFPSEHVKRENNLDDNRNILDGVAHLIQAVDNHQLPELRDLDQFFQQEEFATGDPHRPHCFTSNWAYDSTEGRTTYDALNTINGCCLFIVRIQLCYKWHQPNRPLS